MRESFELANSNYEYIEELNIKGVSDKILIDKVHNTHKFLKMCEIYMSDIKDDYGKKKIASLRVDFVRHQLDILMRECFSRGIKLDLESYSIT